MPTLPKSCAMNKHHGIRYQRTVTGSPLSLVPASTESTESVEVMGIKVLVYSIKNGLVMRYMSE